MKRKSVQTFWSLRCSGGTRDDRHSKEGTYNKSPDDDNGNDINGMGLSGKSLRETTDNDDHQFNTVWENK